MSIPTNNIGSGNIATPDRPLEFKKAKVFDVDTKTFMKCRFCKKPYDRWIKYIDDENLRNEIRKYSQRNTYKPIILKDKSTGTMTYLKIT